MRTRLSSALLFLAMACGEGRDRPPGDKPDGSTKDTGSPDGGSPDGGSPDGGRPDGGPIDTTPILDRTPDLAYDCTAGTFLHVQMRSWAGNGWTHRLTKLGQDAVLARIEREGDPFGIPTVIDARVSTLSASTMFGSPTIIPITDHDQVASVDVDTFGSDLFFVYAGAGGAEGAIISGTSVSGPKPILDVGGSPVSVALATASSRGAILYTVRGLDDRETVLLQPVDTTGAPSAASFEVLRSARTFLTAGANIVVTASGYAVAWRDSKTEGGEIYFRLFGSDGNPAGDTKTVFQTTDEMTRTGSSVGFEGTAVALIAVPDGFVVAWVESHFDPNSFDMGAWAMIALAKLDANGDRIGDRVLLDQPELDVDYVEPELFAHGDDIGLAYGRGDHIYICGGCVPNHTVRMLLLDPSALVPKSQVVEVSPDSGGILFRTTISTGTDILTAFRLVYHVHSEAGAASFQCIAR